MERCTLIILLLLGTQLFTHGQEKIKVTGVVIEKLSQQPLEFATVALLDPSDSSIVTGAATNASGEFQLVAPSGTYTLNVEFIGFHSFIQEGLTLTEDMALPSLQLEANAELLQAVEVTAEKSTIQYQLDKRVFNVGKDILSNGGSATDVLGNVPSVNVESNGQVSLRGNSSVRVLINGKPSVLTNNNGLTTIPAETIDKVEVITNPSSKHDAEGTAGIINIILKKENGSGFSSSLQLKAGVPDDHSINYNMNYKTERFNLFSNVRYSLYKYLGESTTLRTEFENNTVTSFLDQSIDRVRTGRVFNLYFGSDYYINEKNTLTLSYYYRNNVSKNDVTYDYAEIDADQVVDSVTQAVEFYEEPQEANSIELNYVKRFAKERKELTVNLQYDFWNDDENEFIDQRQLFPTASPLSTLRSRDIESSKDGLFQSDLTLPLGEKTGIEMGVKGEVRRIDSDYQVWDNEIIVDSLDNVLRYDEQIFGAYTQYENRKHKVQYLLGIRAEYSDTRSVDVLDQFNYNKNYLNLFPTAHLTYAHNERTNVQLSYSRRIRRPRFWQLNPFGGIADTRNIRVGNPDLNPMYTNSFELAFLKRWEKLTINPSVYYQHTTNLFQTSVARTTEGTLLSKATNFGTEDVYGLEVVTTYSPIKKLRISYEINLFEYEQNGLFVVNDRAWNSRINSTLRYPKWSLQASFDYQAGRKNGQFDSQGQYWANAGLNLDLLKDKASLSFNVRNILDSRRYKELVTGDDYTLQREEVWSGRRVSATFTYRFKRSKNDRDRLPG